jgi:hypothetical protein
MHPHLTHSQTPRAVPLEPTHDEIARRAYEIYLKSECKEGNCNQNWYEAEVKLRKDDHRTKTEARD